MGSSPEDSRACGDDLAVGRGHRRGIAPCGRTEPHESRHELQNGLPVGTRRRASLRQGSISLLRHCVKASAFRLICAQALRCASFDISSRTAPHPSERRALEPRTQLTAQRREARKIIAECKRDGDEGIVRICGKLEQINMMKLTEACAPDAAPAHAGHDRYAHPQGVEARGMPIVGRGIEPQIDVVIGAKVLRSGSKSRRIRLAAPQPAASRGAASSDSADAGPAASAT